MKKTAILVIANLLWVVPVAQANEVARIQSGVGISQEAWFASPEYQAFQCPAGSARTEGADLNFTSNRSDDYYFAYCEEIVPPILPSTATSPDRVFTTDTATATTVTPTPTPTPTTSSSEPAASTNTLTSAVAETSTATSSATPSATTTAAFDYQAFLQMFTAWFQSWFAQFLSSWSVMNR